MHLPAHGSDAPAADGTGPVRVPRSLLFVPGARPDMVAKVPRWAPDAVAVDLEDAVAAADKESAREATVRAVGELAGGDTLVLVRVNGPTTPWYADDVAAVAGSAAHGVVLPKLESPEQLADLRARLDLPVVGGLESAKGIARCRELVSGLLAAYFGAEDYIASVGGRRTPGSLEVLHARSEVVLAGALGGVGLLDQAVVAAHDAEAFRADAAAGRDLGYDGKICIHPSQVALAHEAFTPTDDEVAHARLVIEAGKSGVGVVDGEMVDDVHLRMASAVLARAGLDA
ncbi:CoA ester lyase [Actinomycetospora straminea]|uniref:CoA ester lyase n=1 Tax=Actinomycetospora straminea TaxID=663607 RepID=A0ABP9EQC0_9PSEU